MFINAWLVARRPPYFPPRSLLGRVSSVVLDALLNDFYFSLLSSRSYTAFLSSAPNSPSSLSMATSLPRADWSRTRPSVASRRSCLSSSHTSPSSLFFHSTGFFFSRLPIGDGLHPRALVTVSRSATGIYRLFGTPWSHREFFTLLLTLL